MSENAYRLLKLSNGDNIIANIKKVNQNTLTLEKPFIYKTMSIFSPFGVKNVVLLKKWFEMSDEEIVDLSIDKISSMTKPNKKIILLYLQEKNKKPIPYVSNEELYKNPDLLKMVEDGSPPPSQPIPPSNKEESEEVHGNLHINMKITPEMLEENEALENLLRALGVPVDELLDSYFKSIEDEKDEIIVEEEENSFGNNLSDWSPDPSDYLK